MIKTFIEKLKVVTGEEAIANYTSAVIDASLERKWKVAIYVDNSPVPATTNAWFPSLTSVRGFVHAVFVRGDGVVGAELRILAHQKKDFLHAPLTPEQAKYFKAEFGKKYAAIQGWITGTETGRFSSKKSSIKEDPRDDMDPGTRAFIERPLTDSQMEYMKGEYEKKYGKPLSCDDDEDTVDLTGEIE